MSKGGAENPITNANVAHSSFMGCVGESGEHFGPWGFVWSSSRIVSRCFSHEVCFMMNTISDNVKRARDEVAEGWTKRQDIS